MPPPRFFPPPDRQRIVRAGPPREDDAPLEREGFPKRVVKRVARSGAFFAFFAAAAAARGVPSTITPAPGPVAFAREFAGVRDDVPAVRPKRVQRHRRHRRARSGGGEVGGGGEVAPPRSGSGPGLRDAREPLALGLRRRPAEEKRRRDAVRGDGGRAAAPNASEGGRVQRVRARRRLLRGRKRKSRRRLEHSRALFIGAAPGRVGVDAIRIRGRGRVEPVVSVRLGAVARREVVRGDADASASQEQRPVPRPGADLHHPGGRLLGGGGGGKGGGGPERLFPAAGVFFGPTLGRRRGEPRGVGDGVERLRGGHGPREDAAEGRDVRLHVHRREGGETGRRAAIERVGGGFRIRRGWGGGGGGVVFLLSLLLLLLLGVVPPRGVGGRGELVERRHALAEHREVLVILRGGWAGGGG